MHISPILGIDYGRKRVGVAITRGSLVEPRAILENSPDLINQLKELCEQEHISQVIVGISEGEMAQESERFAQILATELRLPVQQWDETLTTHEAHHRRSQAGKSAPRREHVDDWAAASLLEDWMEAHQP